MLIMIASNGFIRIILSRNRGDIVAGGIAVKYDGAKKIKINIHWDNCFHNGYSQTHSGVC